MKILYVTTISNTINFFTSHVNMLLDNGHLVDFACNMSRPISNALTDRGCKIFQIGFSRSPLNIANINSFKTIKRIIRNERYDIVHVHTPIAATITRFICRKVPNIKIIYTAHGFHFYRGAPLKNWIFYYPVEKYLSKYTDVLITINQEDYKRAKKKFKAKQTEYVPGVGIDINKFTKVVVDRDKKRAELGIPLDSYVVVSVGELNKNKNHSAVIKALKKINNPNIFYLICGHGPLKDKLKFLIQDLDLFLYVKLLGYRSDIQEILKVSDLFVFPSYREGLSVSLMEAMIAGLPIICSKIRGNTDLIYEGMGGYLVEPDDIDGLVASIEKMVDNRDKSIRFVEYNKDKIIEFSNTKVLERMNDIYSGLFI